MDVKTQSDLLAAIITCSIAISLWLRSRKFRLHALFITFNFNLFLYYFSGFLHGLIKDDTLNSLRLFIAIFLPLSSLKFMFAFLSESRSFVNRLYRVCVVLTVLLGLCIITPIRSHVPFVDVLIFIYIFGALYAGVYFIYDKHRVIQSRLEATRLKYLIGGGLLATTFTLLDQTPAGTILPMFGTIFTVLFMYLLSQIIIRFRLLDLYELLGRALVMVVLALIISVIYIVLVVWAGGQTGLFLFNSVVASAVVLILIDPLRYAVETRITRLIFSETFEFTKNMERLRRILANVINIDALAEHLIKGLEKSRRVTHASFYLLLGEHYYLQSFYGPQPAKSLDAIQYRAFITQLGNQKVLIRENLEQEIKALQEAHNLSAHAEMRVYEELLNVMNLLESDVAIPCISESRVIGVINVRDDRLREAFSSDEIKMLLALAAQATITIENSRAYEKMRERDRLATLGEMAAGMAHEIRNPLGAIKGAAQLLEEDLAGIGANQEFMDIIKEEVNRLNKVVSQFLDYSRPLKQHLSEVDINELVRRLTQLLTANMEHSADIDLELDSELSPVQTDPELLKQVFFNFSNNAFQAMPKGGKLTISTESTNGVVGEEGVKIKFHDTGEGIPEKVLTNIFIPFFTTKPQGTGLGLAICQRIISSLGGTVDVTSKVGEGTTFAITLPLSRQLSGGGPSARE